jgi:MYXO-CTERM domain-containing protein
LLRTVLLGQGGAVVDLEENVIEAKPLMRSNATDTAKKANFPAGAAALAMLTIVLLRRRR